MVLFSEKECLCCPQIEAELKNIGVDYSEVKIFNLDDHKHKKELVEAMSHVLGTEKLPTLMAAGQMVGGCQEIAEKA